MSLEHASTPADLPASSYNAASVPVTVTVLPRGMSQNMLKVLEGQLQACPYYYHCAGYKHL